MEKLNKSLVLLENNAKNKVVKDLYYSLVEFINLCSSAGTDGDKEVENKVKRKIVYYDDDPKAFKRLEVENWPEKKEFETLKKEVLSYAKEIKNSKEINKPFVSDIIKIVERIDYEQLDFSKFEFDKNKTKRPNADVFDDLFPYVLMLRGEGRLPKNWLKKHAGAFENENEEKMYDSAIDKISREVTLDHMSKKSMGADIDRNRYNKMHKALETGTDIEKNKRNERSIDNTEKSLKNRGLMSKQIKNAKTEEEKIKAKENLKQAEKDYFHNRFADLQNNQKLTWQEYCDEKKIESKKLKELVNLMKKWKDKGEKNTIEVYGSVRGRGEQGVLIFVPEMSSKYGEDAPSINGKKLFRFIPKILDSLKKEGLSEAKDVNYFSEFISDKRKDKQFTSKVKKMISSTSERIEEALELFAREFIM